MCIIITKNLTGRAHESKALLKFLPIEFGSRNQQTWGYLYAADNMSLSSLASTT